MRGGFSRFGNGVLADISGNPINGLTIGADGSAYISQADGTKTRVPFARDPDGRYYYRQPGTGAKVYVDAGTATRALAANAAALPGASALPGATTNWLLIALAIGAAWYFLKRR